MKYLVRSTNQYDRSFKKLVFSGKIYREEIESVVEIIVSGEKLPVKFKDHKLKGDLAYFRECHIKPDVLLVYKIEKKEIILVLVNIGTHNDLFRK